MDDRIKGVMEIEKYRHPIGVKYERPNGVNGGFAALPAFEFLWGLPLSNMILAYCEALHPTAIRVIGHDQMPDPRPLMGRVTVALKRDRTVEWITIESTVLYGTGGELKAMLEAARDKEGLDGSREPT